MLIWMCIIGRIDCLTLLLATYASVLRLRLPRFGSGQVSILRLNVSHISPNVSSIAPRFMFCTSSTLSDHESVSARSFRYGCSSIHLTQKPMTSLTTSRLHQNHSRWYSVVVASLVFWLPVFACPVFPRPIFTPHVLRDSDLEEARETLRILHDVDPTRLAQVLA